MFLLEDKRFYVYAYLDTKKQGKFKYENFVFNFEPFYIGKGKDNRFLSHIKDSENHNAPRHIRIRELKCQNLSPVVLIVKNYLNQNDAFELESSLIKLIGRLDKKQGPLLNCTDGGQGQVNRKFTDLHKQKISQTRLRKNIKHTKETLEKIRLKRTGQKLSLKSIENVKNAILKRDPETQKKFIFSRLGKKNNENQKKAAFGNLKEKNAKKWEINFKGQTLVITNLKKWCKINNVKYDSRKTNEFKLKELENKL